MGSGKMEVLFVLRLCVLLRGCKNVVIFYVEDGEFFLLIFYVSVFFSFRWVFEKEVEEVFLGEVWVVVFFIWELVFGILKNNFGISFVDVGYVFFDEIEVIEY